MIAQEGDHFAHPSDDAYVSETALDPAFVAPNPDPLGTPITENDPFRVMARTVNALDAKARRFRFGAQVRRPPSSDQAFADEIDESQRRAYAFGVFGIPSRSLLDEDRAQEARRGARVMRRRGWSIMTTAVHSARTADERAYHVAIIRLFVPRSGDPLQFVRHGWDIDDARIGVFQR